MVLRGAVTVFMETEKNFHRVRGDREIATLDAALHAAVTGTLDNERLSA